MKGLLGFRRTIHRQLDPEAWTAPGLSPLNWVIFAAIWISILFGILDTEPAFREAYGGALLVIDRAILVLFAVEYGARLATCTLNPRFRGPFGFLKYLTRPASIADLIVIAPLFFAISATWMPLFRLLRILRLVRLASMPNVHRAFREFAEAIAAKRFELALTGAASAVLVLASSTLLYLVEGRLQPQAFGSIPRAAWWSVVTFTTVGYGDAIPLTPLGKFIAGAFAICGIGLVAMLTGVIASALSEAAELHERNKQDRNDSGGGGP